MRRLRRVKIIATLGPASNSEKVIEALARAGADVFRINMSHASHDLMRETVAQIRSVERTLDHPLGILVDLQGPKLRVGKFAEGAVQLSAGQTFTLDSSSTPGDSRPRLPARIPKSSRASRSAIACCSTTASCSSRPRASAAAPSIPR